MRVHKSLTAREIALVVCFTALYAVFSTIPIFQVLGMPNKQITAGAITVPIIGILLGPFIGTLSVVLGGIISFFAGAFFPPSFVSGIVAASCAGFLNRGKRIWSILLYVLLLMLFDFYPLTGPAWLFPLYMWFQVVGLLVLLSPLQSMAIKNLETSSSRKLVVSFFIIFLPSTLTGQISGTLAYMLVYPPAGSWQMQWQGLSLFYPFERTVIALAAAFIGAPLYKVLRSGNLIRTASPGSQQEKLP